MSRTLQTRIARSAGAAAAVALVTLATLVSCQGRGAASPAAAPGGSWYQLESGIFQPVAGPAAAVVVARKPWTVQSRVADMAWLGETLYLAVNGGGLAEAVIGVDGSAGFVYHLDALIFAHRTVTAIVPRQGTLVAHLYFNALLNDAQQKDLTLAGVSLVSYLPGKSDFSFLIPPFQRKNPDWEAVGFAPESQDSFAMEWKFTDAAETRFAYTRFHPDTKAEETVSRDAFLAALGVPSTSGPAVPSDLSAFFDACKAGIPSLSAGSALQFSLRSRENPVRTNYRSEPESESALSISVFEAQGERYALLPSGQVLVAALGARHTIDLPALPEEFRYTDIIKASGFLVVSWEEVSFTDVGRAGILVFRI
jgi:hypothetical protein